MVRTRITAEPGVSLLLIEREFDAPRDLVFRAHVDPDLLVRWLGPHGYRMRIDHYDARDGGTYRYVHIDPDGAEYAFHGVFHGDPSPGQIVQTFEFEGFEGHVSLETARLEERDGRTILRAVSVFQSVEDRDGMTESGMKEGVNQGYERLDQLLAELQTKAA